MSDLCQICHKPLQRAGTNACKAHSNIYYQIRERISESMALRELVKDVNNGFAYDEVSVLL